MEPRPALLGRPVLFDPFDGGPRGRGTLARLNTGSAVVRTVERPSVGTGVRLRVFGTPFGELSLPSVVRWHADDAIGLQIGVLRARQMFALNRLTLGDPNPRLRLRRQGFELDSIDVLALAALDAATMVLPPAHARRRCVLWLRNAQFEANLLELDANRIVISAPVSLGLGTRVALSVPQLARSPVDIPAEVVGVAAGRTALAYARARREAA